MTSNDIFDEIGKQKGRGVLLVLTGPSGSGKDTVFSRLKSDDNSVVRIITTTTRKPREGEIDGVHYFFVKREEFEDKISHQEFFEWVEFRGELYGTRKKTLEDALLSGHDVIWRIEAKGVKNIKSKIKSLAPRSVFVYLTAESIEKMHDRVIGDEGREGMQKRWNEALVMWEIRQYSDCEYLVVNPDGMLENTLSSIRAIMLSKKLEILDKKA
jgi:guanylate kinase